MIPIMENHECNKEEAIKRMLEDGRSPYTKSEVELMDRGAKEPTINGFRKEQNEAARHILWIAEQINKFIDERQWSWCDMEKVYKVLKTIRQG